MATLLSQYPGPADAADFSYAINSIEWTIGTVGVRTGDASINTLLRTYPGPGSPAGVAFGIDRCRWAVGQLGLRTGDASALTLLDAFPGPDSPGDLRFFTDQMAYCLNILDTRTAYLPQTLAYLAAIPDAASWSAAQRTVLNTFIQAEITAGTWAITDAIYPLRCPGASGNSLVNLKNPGTYNATVVGSPTFVALDGWTGAASAYLDTNFGPSTAVAANFVLNSANFGIYSLTAAQVAACAMGQLTASTQRNYLYTRYTDNKSYSRCNASADLAPTNTDGSGALQSNRTGAALTQVYRNSTELANGTGAAAALITSHLVMLGGIGEFWTGKAAMGWLGAGLTPTQIAARSTNVAAYVTGIATA